MDGSVTLVGMDLGTFRTSIVSSNGRRAELETVVGWPKDYVARSVLGQDVIYGEEAIERRMALEVIRPFAGGAFKYNEHTECGVPEELIEKHKQAASLLVKRALELTEPSKNDAIYGVIGVPSRASIVNKRVILEAARSAFDAVMLAPEPFAVAYSTNQLINALVVDIGAGTIDICPMFGTFPSDDDQLTIPFGGDSIDEEFHRNVLAEFTDARMSYKMARETKEKYGFVHDSNDKILIKLPVQGKPQALDVTKHLKQACLKIVAPIVDGITEMVARYDPEVQQSLLSNIVLGGGGSQLKGLDRLLEQSLEPYGGSNVSQAHDSVYAGAVGALKIAMGMPTEYWNRLARMEITSTVEAE